MRLLKKKQLRCQPQTVKHMFLRRLFSFPPMWQACTSACSRRERWLCGLCDTISRDRDLSDARTCNKQTTAHSCPYRSNIFVCSFLLMWPNFTKVTPEARKLIGQVSPSVFVISNSSVVSYAPTTAQELQLLSFSYRCPKQEILNILDFLETSKHYRHFCDRHAWNELSDSFVAQQEQLEKICLTFIALCDGRIYQWI